MQSIQQQIITVNFLHLFQFKLGIHIDFKYKQEYML